MFDVFGFMLVKRLGCFARWLLLGSKGKFDDFYTEKNLFIVDYLVGGVIFFAIMFVIVDVFKWKS